ncbi:glycosyl hydrolase 115 family protein [Mangrovibacterium lignilyticum]|uniref:glycosyl hydrolase 115 family protein n=1 Tax=Mangrovibacterium lignilyticum TaxID=2668052 RepID=UPI0013D4C1C6|nr:glycosyl hydrolase 115 family protein [Mangrovibacterium lignilyticum]
MKKKIIISIFCAICLLPQMQVYAQKAGEINSFTISEKKAASAILISEDDAKVVSIAANLFARDVENITEKHPKIINELSESADELIIAGTMGKNDIIDQLIAEKKIDVSAVDGKWESWSMQVIEKPFPGVKKALVIIGSDRRATTYGILELSRMMGVSTWEWWADVLPQKRKEITLDIESKTYSSPSVKYRGLFLNDEDWGLQPWAAKTFEPETGDIGPKTYAKIFELMLRLRANTIWPAMHGCTKAFYTIDGNAQTADDYAIVVGTSHCEPMLCNINAEWNHNTMGEWRYDNNAETIRDLFEKRTKATSNFESIYTIGMRGEHDSPMNAKDLTKEDQMKLLEKVIADQREIMAKETGKDPETLPQAFIPYKEVLDYYQNGLEVPEDVTLMWTDDNYGYIRQLSTPEEQKRPGGGGIYYHASYWGRPHDYLWLSSTNPMLMWEEMYKAYQFNCHDMWILNCGDIKPLEYNIEMFMDMAWDIDAFTGTKGVEKHLNGWLSSLFGKEKAPQLTKLMMDYYHLCFMRRPEFMAWSQTEPTIKPQETELTQIRYGDELTKYLQAWERLAQEVKVLDDDIPAGQKDAFFELVYYPVTGASLMNQKWLYHYKNELVASQGRASAQEFAKLSKEAYEQIKTETKNFNNKLVNGKWKNMMSMAPRNLPVFSQPSYALPAEDGEADWGLVLEGYDIEANKSIPNAYSDVLPLLNAYLKDSAFVDVFLKGGREVDWKAEPKAPWIRLSADHGKLTTAAGEQEQRLWVSIDWDQLPQGENTIEAPLGQDYQLIPPAYKVYGTIEFSTDDTTVTVNVSTFNPKFKDLENYEGFVEGNGYVSINAENTSSKKAGKEADWKQFGGIGYSGNVVVALPYNAKPVVEPTAIKEQSPMLEYDFYTFNFGEADVQVQAVPTHPFYEGASVRCALAVDDAEPVIIDFKTVGRSNEWKQNVLKNAAVKSAKQMVAEPGKHKLKVWMVDPGVMIDQILIDLGGWKSSYAFPPETRKK